MLEAEDSDRRREESYALFQDHLARNFTAHSLALTANSDFDVWLHAQMKAALPVPANSSFSAALDAAAGEITAGISNAASHAVSGTIAHGGWAGFKGIKTDITASVVRGAVEAAKAAAAASDIAALNYLELEYSLSSGGLDEYSLLTVQPLSDSENLRHNVFAQGSYAHKQGRDTANLGVAYRYVTPDEQHMLGANASIDHQWPHHHSRLGVGLDYKTSLIGAHLNHYIGLSGWRNRPDLYDEKAVNGTDVIISGRFPQLPELELFTRGFHWDQEKTATLNPDGGDIWGYELTAEFRPVNALTFEGTLTKDNERDHFQGTASVRVGYRFGQTAKDLFRRPTYNLNSVLDRRFDKIRRSNDIRVQLRRDPAKIGDNGAAPAGPVTYLGLSPCPPGDLSTPANAACARLFGADPESIDDVGVYAGDVPGTATDFFVRRCDIGQDYDPVDDRCEDGGGDPAGRSLLPWKNVATDSVTANIGTGTSVTNAAARDGPNNTALLVADGSGTHMAAETCNGLAGTWYLPGISELDIIYANLAATDDPDHPLPNVNHASDTANSGTTGPLRGSFDVTGLYYWSSSEINATLTLLQRFSEGNQTGGDKTTNRAVRCARRN